jgi:hypothetical protein
MTTSTASATVQQQSALSVARSSHIDNVSGMICIGGRFATESVTGSPGHAVSSTAMTSGYSRDSRMVGRQPASFMKWVVLRTDAADMRH